MMETAKRGAVWLGLTAGVLTALTTDNGMTATLVGLLFAMIGGSVVPLFRAPEKPADDSGPVSLDASVAGVFSLLGGVCVGILIGLLVGFALKVVDGFVLQPRLIQARVKAIPQTLLDAAEREPQSAAQVIESVLQNLPGTLETHRGTAATTPSADRGGRSDRLRSELYKLIRGVEGDADWSPAETDAFSAFKQYLRPRATPQDLQHYRSTLDQLIETRIKDDRIKRLYIELWAAP